MAQRRVQQVFRTQRPNENVLLITRRHWWAWVRWLFLPIVAVVGLWILAGAVPVLAGVLVFVSLIFFVACTLYLYLEWANDSIIITDQRIVRITQSILGFSQRVSDINIASIQEINAEIPPFNPFAWMFNYGYIELRTAGEAGNISLQMIPDPEGVQDLILDDFRNLKDSRQQQHQNNTERDVQQWIQGGNTPQPFQPLNPPSVTSLSRLETPPFSPFTSHFTLKDGSTVFRKHWFVWFQGVFVPLLVILGTVIGFFASLALGVGGLGSVVSLGVFIIAGAWFYWADWDWRHDYMMVSHATLTIVHQRPLWLQNEKDQVLMKQIDNVVAETSGFWNRIWGKGSVQIALIGSNTYKEFRDVQDALFVQSEIMRRQGIAKNQQTQDLVQNQRQMMGDYMTTYHQMTGAPNTAQQPPQYEPARPFASSSQDAQRPPIVPQSRPNLSQGRPYSPPVQPRPQGQQPQPSPFGTRPQGQPQQPPQQPPFGARPQTGQAPPLSTRPIRPSNKR